MLEKINEPISIIASFTRGPKNTVRILPHLIGWRNQRYKVDIFGLYHTERRGTKQIHIFSFSSSSACFRVELDPDTLIWTLIEVYYED